MSNVINRMDRFGFLEVRSECRDGSHVIALSGELDIDGVDRVTVQLRNAEKSDAREIVLDLSALEFIDSSGIQLVIAADARSRADDRRLRLIRGPDRVQRVFDMCGVADGLPFVD